MNRIYCDDTGIRISKSTRITIDLFHLFKALLIPTFWIVALYFLIISRAEFGIGLWLMGTLAVLFIKKRGSKWV